MGYFNVGYWSLVFFISFLISSSLSYFISIRRIYNKICNSLSIELSKRAKNILNAFITNLIYTPILLFFIVYVVTASINTDIINECKLLQNDINNMQNDLQSNRDDYDSVSVVFDEEVEKLNTLTIEYLDKEKQLENLKDNYRTDTARVNELESIFESTTEDVKELKEEWGNLKAGLIGLSVSIEEIYDALEKEKVAIDELTKSTDIMQEHLASNIQEINRLKRAISDDESIIEDKLACRTTFLQNYINLFFIGFATGFFIILTAYPVYRNMIYKKYNIEL